MTDKLPHAVERLRAWMRDYGDQKQPAFIEDLSEALRAVDEAERFADETIATVDWLNSLSTADGAPLSMVTIRVMEDRTIHLVVGDYVAPEPLTCGALRMYAKCLGISLKESTP